MSLVPDVPNDIESCAREDRFILGVLRQAKLTRESARQDRARESGMKLRNLRVRDAVGR